VVAALSKPRESARESAERKRREAEERNARHRRTRDLRTALADADAASVDAERELAGVTERLADPAVYADAAAVRDLVERHNALRDRVDALAHDRERLTAELEAAEAEPVPAAR
jgi:ATP-binding cassette subfamily F protein 3